MSKNVLKVIVKEGYEDSFKQYCEENDIVCSQYSIDILKTRFGVECKEEQLVGAKDIIEKIMPMPIVTIG